MYLALRFVLHGFSSGAGNGDEQVRSGCTGTGRGRRRKRRKRNAVSVWRDPRAVYRHFLFGAPGMDRRARSSFGNNRFRVHGPRQTVTGRQETFSLSFALSFGLYLALRFVLHGFSSGAGDGDGKVRSGGTGTGRGRRRRRGEKGTARTANRINPGPLGAPALSSSGPRWPGSARPPARRRRRGGRWRGASGGWPRGSSRRGRS